MLLEVNNSDLKLKLNMGKKSHKRSSPGKNNGSFLWGFISLFDFSQTHNPRRLLADRKRGSARYPGISHQRTELLNPFDDPEANVGDVCGAAKVNSALPSVKALIEKEMSKEKSSKSSGSKKDKNQKVNQNHKTEWNFQNKNLKNSAQLCSEPSNCRNTIEGSNLIVDLAALMMEFYCISHHFPDIHANLEDDFRHNSLDESNSLKLQEALTVEAEAFLGRKINDAKQLVGNGIIQSEEFMDALEILNSNKELFLKLIQDSKSFVFRHIKELHREHIPGLCLEEKKQMFENRDTRHTNKSASNHILHKQKQGFFSKKVKSRGKNPSKTICSTKEIKRIVVLKPCSLSNHGDPATSCLSPKSHYFKERDKDTERVSPPVFFRKLKNKLRHIINDSRKDEHLISRNGDLQRIQHADEVLDYRNRNRNVENTGQASMGVRKIDERRKTKDCQENFAAESAHENRHRIASFPLQSKESFFYQEVNKHPSEMLGDEYATDILDCHRLSSPLFTGNVLSPKDYNPHSPRFSPHGEKEVKLSTNQTSTSPMLLLINEGPTYLSPWNQNLEEIPCSRSYLDVENRVVYLKELNMDVNHQEGTSSVEQANTEGSDEIIAIEKGKYIYTNIVDDCNTLHIPGTLEACANSSCEIYNEEGCCTPSKSGAPDKKSQILIPSTSTSPASLIINQFKSSEFIIEKPDKQSPESVLEPIFLEDNASPDLASNECIESSPRPIYLNVNINDSMIVKQRSYADTKEATNEHVITITENTDLISEVLPLSAFIEVEEDPKLLLECVNEILLQIKERHFQFSPWVTFIMPNVRPILKGDEINQVVYKTIQNYLSSQFQFSIDEIKSKDLDNARWLDLGIDMDCIIREVCSCIFEEILQETMFELHLLSQNDG